MKTQQNTLPLASLELITLTLFATLEICDPPFLQRKSGI